ncbi:hypothetical protein [Plantactinospora endophytica]|uniref:DUF4352 domain-containing protein n=1 Tax=Plantactinospora endophytica TaxID=673535 RepID=A0ABQ4DT75_9ACTN|nr:hypothetical protein [Plantactinospora endophytica]GIG85650.1 hypothetical protein Pen02_05860 [Plantactinospora endophytica]
MSRRTILLATALLAVLLLVMAGAWWVIRPGDEPTTAVCPYPVISNGVTSAVPNGDNRTTITAPSGGAVTVVESGFTQIADQSQVSIGAVVENNSSQVAYRTRVIFGAFDVDGDYALEEARRFNYFFEIPIIRPGERAMIGTYASVDAANFTRTGIWTTVVRASLHLIQTQWIPAADTGTFPAITARLNPEKPPVAEDGRVTVHLAANSDACRELGGRGMAMVFRDGVGAVVGGAFDGIRNTELCVAGDFTARALTFDSNPPKADLTRTEVDVYCDLTPSSYLPASPTQPVN